VSTVLFKKLSVSDLLIHNNKEQEVVCLAMAEANYAIDLYSVFIICMYTLPFDPCWCGLPLPYIHFSVHMSSLLL
jgi:hypothetical protein